MMEESLRQGILGLLQSLEKTRERGDFLAVKVYSEAIVNLTNALTMAYGGELASPMDYDPVVD